MSEAITDLLRLAKKLERMRKSDPNVLPLVQAYKLISREDKNTQDRILSSAVLNRQQFLNAARTDETLLKLHQAIIAAAIEFRNAESGKEARHAISRTNPR